MNWEKRMRLKQKQFLFARLLPQLINYMLARGYHPVMGFAYRCEDCKIGKEKSLHKLCLAVDIELHDADGNYLLDTEDHRVFGDFWERLHPLCSWGGDFDDGGHYSIRHRGMR